MRVLVCGGRNYDDWHAIRSRLEQLRPSVVITGACPTGADYFAERWAKQNEVATISVPAQWKLIGNKSAGQIRNQRMLDEFKPDLVLAFHGGRGTADMVLRARKAGIPVREQDGTE